MARLRVEIEISGPLHQDPRGCRRCGACPTDVYQIVGLTVGDPVYFRCRECGLGEVVRGTPMDFGEPSLGGAILWERYRHAYNVYRRSVGLPLLPETWPHERDG